jgi:hypothetical protein
LCLVATSTWANDALCTAKAGGSETRSLPGGASLTFSKDAKYEIGRPIRLQLAPTGADKTTVQVIKLSSGHVSVTIPEAKNPKTAVLIQGPRKVSAVAKGGQTLVIAAPDRVTVAAQQGEMLVALGNDWKVLPSGFVRSFGGGGTTEQRVPQVPELKLANSLLLALGGAVTTQLLATPNQAVEYRHVSLYRVEGGKRSKLSESEWHGNSQVLPELSAGRYEVSASAVDHFGVESAPSAPLPLRVVGVELPEGARLASDVIFLGRSGRVKLVGADGLEASYGRATVFIPVPRDIGLARGESTMLRLREVGAEEEVDLRLEPRTLKADVSIGPPNARWPGDSLRVTVKLFGPLGRPVTEELKTKPRVFVNVHEIEPTWAHVGNTFTTRVAPAGGAGPWVVRVEVMDDFGDQVGRNFIELGGSGKTSSAN